MCTSECRARVRVGGLGVGVGWRWRATDRGRAAAWPEHGSVEKRGRKLERDTDLATFPNPISAGRCTKEK